MISDKTRKLSLFARVATLGPIGYIRPAPGTIGSLIGLFSGYAISILGTGLLAAATLLVTVIGAFFANAYIIETHRKDPPEVIIDEVVGQWITVIILPHDLYWYLAGFALFRFFDIVKPGPVRIAEALPGGVGIMADDIIAGLLAALSLWAFSFF